MEKDEWKNLGLANLDKNFSKDTATEQSKSQDNSASAKK
jgi:hypothetical protein